MQYLNLTLPGQPLRDGDRFKRIEDDGSLAFGVWPPTRAPLPVVSHYQFVTEHLTAAENDAWLALRSAARKALEEGTATQAQKDQLRAYEHFQLAGAVDFAALETQIAFLAMHQWGVLTEERAGALGRGEKVA